MLLAHQGRSGAARPSYGSPSALDARRKEVMWHHRTSHSEYALSLACAGGYWVHVTLAWSRAPPEVACAGSLDQGGSRPQVLVLRLESGETEEETPTAGLGIDPGEAW